MLMNPQQVQDMLGVSNHSLKYWRDLKRLPGGVDNPLHLPAIPDESNPNVVWYDVDDVMDFVARNERYRDRILAKYAPQDVRTTLTPLASINARALWADIPEPTTPPPSPSAWAGLFAEHPQPSQGKSQ